MIGERVWARVFMDEENGQAVATAPPGHHFVDGQHETREQWGAVLSRHQARMVLVQRLQSGGVVACAQDCSCFQFSLKVVA